MGINGQNQANFSTVKTPKGRFASQGLRTKETGLPLSGNIVQQRAYLVVAAPAYTAVGNKISFSDFIDLSAVRVGDTFEDSLANTYTITKVEFEISDDGILANGTFDITLDGPPAVLTAGGSMYRTATMNGIITFPVSAPGGAGMAVNIRDESGNAFTLANPLPVELSDGSISIGTVNAEVEVQLSHQDNVPDAGDVADSVRIGDGTNELAVNADGSINVKQSTHDDLNLNANMQVGDVDVANGNPVPISDAGSTISIDDNGGSITVDGAVSTSPAYNEETWTVTDIAVSESTAYSADLKSRKKGSVHIVWSGLTQQTSIVHLEGSNDGGSSWDQINFSTVALNSAAGNELLLLDELYYENLRVVYTPVSYTHLTLPTN